MRPTARVSLPAPGSNPAGHRYLSAAQPWHAWDLRLAGGATRGRGAAPGGDPEDRRYLRALICPARARSAAVSPPSECVDRVSVTRFHWIVMSGWWFAVSAR